MKKQTIKNIEIIFGIYLILDGIVSIIYFKEQPVINHLARVGRALIGLYFLRR